MTDMTDLVAAGYIFIALMKAHWLALRMLILPAGFGVFIGASYFAVGVTKSLDYKYELEIESLLICIVAGFFVVNFSDYHHRFCHVLEESGPYIFIPFFTLVGASLNLQIFVQSIGFAVILFILRGVCIFLGTFLSGRLVGQDANVNKYLWMTLMPQGGFSFGVAATISNIFPGWGESLQALIVSCVIVNQMIGPIFIKRAMAWSGDAGKSSGNEAQEEEDADPHSHLPDSELGCGPGDEEAGVAFGPRHSIINPITTVSIFTPMEHRHASPVEPTPVFPGVASYENQGRDNPGHFAASADGTFQVRNKVKREVSAEVMMQKNEELNRARFISMPAMALSPS
jgi:predicted permease